jgi:ATP-dependent protease ClpP protease subunit
MRGPARPAALGAVLLLLLLHLTTPSRAFRPCTRRDVLLRGALLRPASAALRPASAAADDGDVGHGDGDGGTGDVGYSPPTVYFYDEVTRESVLSLTQALLASERASLALRSSLRLASAPPVHLHVSSGGGSLSAGLLACDVIDRLRCPVYTFVEGSVASAASLISVCGRRRYMTRRSTLLLHQASMEVAGSVRHDELQDESYNMGLLARAMTAVYREHTSLSTRQVERLLADERYLTAREAARLGLVDVVLA